MPDRAIAPLEELAHRILDECGAEWKDVSTVEWTAKVIAEQLRLERAAALKMAGEYVLNHDNLGNIAQREILALLSDSDRSALEAHDAEVATKGIRATLNFPDSGGLYHMVLAENPDKSKFAAEVRDRALKEAAVYCEALGEPEVAAAIREKRGSK